MAQFDIHNDLLARVALNTATIAASATTNGVIIDTQGFNALEFFLQVGTRTDGSFTIQLQHGDDPALADAVAVDTAKVLGNAALTAITAANSVRRIGYVGNKRYVRAQVVSTSVTSGATVGVLAVLGRPNLRPTAAN
ncbi:hypothetical protein [Methylorubrum sp. SB2]|uniref:hypothetical protein n=1 Tax=Methylorubrum subtropicum TaxID=3138812 RepID=UPI00313DFA1B